MNKIFKIICITILCFILVGCSDKNKNINNGNSGDNTGNNNTNNQENIIETYSPIKSVDDYLIRLSYFAAVAYDKRLCNDDRVFVNDNTNFCKITLKELKDELKDMDVAILDTFNGVKCDENKIAVVINLNNSSSTFVEDSAILDNVCFEFPIKKNKK